MKTPHSIQRLARWWLTVGVLLGLVAWIAPQQLGVLIYKLLQVSLGLVVGYMADRVLYRHTTPIDLLENDHYAAGRLVSRAIIVAAVLVSLCIGL